MKRVVVFRNGSNEDGKVILLKQSVQDLLTLASTKLGINARKLYTKQGGEVDDTEVIRDDEMLYVSAGEPFAVPEEKFPSFKHSKNMELTAVVVNSEWITLNVGGQYFTTTKSTLLTKEPNSMLARMFASDDSESSLAPSNLDQTGAYLIDRSPLYFEPILNFLRHGELILDRNVNPQGVLEEAKFFGIESIIPQLEDVISDDESCKDDSALTRRDVISALICTSHSSELRFQGVNLAGADLSRLDLRFINFKYANLQRCNLSGSNLCYCCLERADLSHANLMGATLLAVKMLCANLEGANLQSCNFEDPAGSHAYMEEFIKPVFELVCSINLYDVLGETIPVIPDPIRENKAS
ncbi:BTB/POZ domain-containing protein KCTD9 [Nymphon striatum]|nr:BTB/POZ domain-containing protein KCTD9 [Nymphon striatum]